MTSPKRELSSYQLEEWEGRITTLHQKENSMDKVELKDILCEIPGADEIQNIHVCLFS